MHFTGLRANRKGFLGKNQKTAHLEELPQNGRITNFKAGNAFSLPCPAIKL
jgi:hypothetical protein